MRLRRRRSADRAEIYRDDRGEFRSRIVAANGRTLFDSGEGYRRRLDCEAIVRSRFPGIRVRFEGAQT